jgi:aspartyl/glutamyl-tRNA(Asn/Gln) amidotransferase subunit B (EC 6.3.5.-)
MRTKEEAHDYRYFPDPDLLPVVIKDEEIQQIKNSLPELPDQKYHRYIEKLGLPEYDAEVLTSDKALANYFEKVIEIFPQNPKLVANWILNELLGKLNEKGLEIENSPISPNSLAELLSLITDGTISGKIAKDVFEIAFETQKSPKQIVEEKGLKQISNEDEIRKIVKDILAKFPAEVEKYKSGNEKILGFLIGQVMKETKGKANPQLVNKIIKEELQ